MSFKNGSGDRIPSGAGLNQIRKDSSGVCLPKYCSYGSHVYTSCV